MAIKRRDLVQWIFFLGFLSILFFTDLGTEIKAGFQRVMLYTGLFQPNLHKNEKTLEADYQMGLVSFDGRKVSLSDHKGQVIFINFWASWCPPCLAEMPEIEKLYAELSEHDVEFFMISLDQDEAKARKLLERKKYQFPSYLMNSQIPAIYSVPSIPTTYVISPQGEIVFSKHGLADYADPEFMDFLKNLAVSN